MYGVGPPEDSAAVSAYAGTEMRRVPGVPTGFTILETLVALSVVAVLLAGVILAVNPGRQGAQARNTQRRADVAGIAFAIKYRAAQNQAQLSPGIDTTLRMLGTDATGCNVSCGAGSAQTFDVQLAATADTYLDEAAPTTPKGGEARIQVYPWEPNWTKRSLIRFDLSSIPAGVTVTSATLNLFEAGTFGATRTIGAHRVTRDWTEAAATWMRADAATNWSTPGGDFVSSPTTTTTLSWDGVLGWFQWDLASDVQAFVAGSSTNNGWLLKDTVEDGSQAYWFFESREGTPGNRPYLRVQYTLDGGVPTAASCLDLRADLSPRYLTAVPEDPRYGTAGKTQYAVRREDGNRLHVRACRLELNERIETTQ